jgi:hypothetical protein
MRSQRVLENPFGLGPMRAQTLDTGKGEFPCRLFAHHIMGENKDKCRRNLVGTVFVFATKVLLFQVLSGRMKV